MTRLKKGDKVVVTTGNDKGQTGEILSFIKEKVLVQGLNVKKKHVKKQGQQPGRIIDMEAPIHISNIAAADKEGNPVKLKVRFNDNGDKELVYKKGDEVILYRSVKKSS